MQELAPSGALSLQPLLPSFLLPLPPCPPPPGLLRRAFCVCRAAVAEGCLQLRSGRLPPPGLSAWVLVPSPLRESFGALTFLLGKAETRAILRELVWAVGGRRRGQKSPQNILPASAAAA